MEHLLVPTPSPQAHKLLSEGQWGQDHSSQGRAGGSHSTVGPWGSCLVWPGGAHVMVACGGELLMHNFMCAGPFIVYN